MKWHGYCGSYTGCQQTSAPEVNDSPSPAYKLSAPVGAPPRSRNLSIDVFEVQRALNRFSPADGGPNPPLVVDGICGPKTIAAIRGFQLKKFGWSGADGVVDPGQQTERALFAGTGQNAYGPWGPPSPQTTPTTPAAEMYANVARALTIIVITRSQISSARSFRSGGLSTGFGEGAWKKLVKHFQVDKSSNWEKTLSDIDRVYMDMQTAIGHEPQGVVLFVDQSPTSTRGAFAWAVSGGYALERRGQQADTDWPAGSILVMRRMRTLKPDAYAYVLIHELAHFVGPIKPDITDFAYHFNEASYAALRPEQRIRNADCYAQFAFDAIGKPFKHSEHEL